MRMPAFVILAAVLLSIFAVSFENKFWAFWEKGKPSEAKDPLNAEPGDSRLTGFAQAVPLGESFTGNDGNEVQDIKTPEANEELQESERAPTLQDAKVSLDEAEVQEESAVDSDAPGVLESFNVEGDNEIEEEDSSDTDGLGTSEQIDESKQSSEENSPYQQVSERRSRAKSFMVVFMGHSGSTAFITELRTHSEFQVERLEPLDHGEYQRNTDLALERARELMDQGIANGKIPGFKIRPWHISNEPERWQSFTKEYDTRIIWQYRENIVKQAIGEYRHRFLNDSSVVEGLKGDIEPCAKGSGQKCRIKIEDMRGLHGLMNDFSSSDELLASAARKLKRDKDMSIVRYEDYLYHRERTLRETFDFLGVDYQDTAPQRRKASPDSLCEMVSNFQEVCDHFLQCQLWRPYLHDPVNNCKCKPGNWKTFDSSYCRRSAWYQSK